MHWLGSGCASVIWGATATLAAAQGAAPFGDARIGLGYNIDNDGDATGEDDLRAISRVRFGANMTGESESGIVFGAEVRADNAEGGEGGTVGQFEGSVFVSGAFGTLSFGDTDGADAWHVGDLPEVGLTELGSEGETPFISNGGGFGDDDDLHFAENPVARPTLRYDYGFGGFGVSLSSNRDLDDIGVGGSWTGEIGDSIVTVGAGYYSYSEFVAVDPEEDDPAAEAVVVPPGEQWSAAVGGEFGPLEGKATYSSAESDGGSGFETLGAGLVAELDAWQLDLYYIKVIDASGTVAGLDGDDSYGVGVVYDLGGAAQIASGVAVTYADETVADLGIGMEF